MRAALRIAPLSLCFGIVLYTSPAAAGETLVPGDVNCDAHVDISDAVFLLSYLYLGAGPPCPLGDRPELLAQVTDLEGKVAQLEADVAAGVQKLADQAAEATASEAALLAQLDAKGSALQAKADELAACRAELQAFKDNHFEECRNRWDRFVRNGDGTVSDQCTGLMWTQSALDLNGDGIFNAVDRSVFMDRATWQGVNDGATALRVGGYADWRLPQTSEFASLKQDEDATLSFTGGCLSPAFDVPNCCDSSGDLIRFWTGTKYEIRLPGVNSPMYWVIVCFRASGNSLRTFWSFSLATVDSTYFALAVRQP